MFSPMNREKSQQTSFPAKYGEVMGPFSPDRLPANLRDLYESDPVFFEWIVLMDTVRRAEKISCWTQWTPEEHAAYKAKDLSRFSRLRGYTESEIADFSRYMALIGELTARYGEGFCLDVSYLHSQIVMTDALQSIEQELCRMSEAACAQANAERSTIRNG